MPLQSGLSLMREVTVHDCETVIVTPEDCLLDQLRESIRMTENDRRWLKVNDQTPVTWNDGSVCTWGSLMLQDRKVVEMHADGSLHGGYG